MNKLSTLASKIEGKLKKLAAMPDEASIRKIIVDVYDANKSNPALKGTQGIVPQISVSQSIGDKVLVYFQVIASPKDYISLVEEPQRSSLMF